MTKKRLLFIGIIFISVILNVIFIFYFNSVSLVDKGNSSNSIQTKEFLIPRKTNGEKAEKYELKNAIKYNQIFYGKWEITDYVSADIPLPSAYSGFDENGKFRGPDVTSVIGKEIIFGENYAEYSGKKYQFVYGPETYTHALQSDEDQIGYNYARSLGITGNYYSIVYFLLPNNYQVAKNDNYESEMRIDDLCFLYIKDNKTIYASNGIITYMLKRLPME